MSTPRYFNDNQMSNGFDLLIQLMKSFTENSNLDEFGSIQLIK